MDTLQDPSPDDLAGTWQALTGGEIDAGSLDSLVAVIRAWPTGRLATTGGPHGRTVIASWQRVGGSAYVTLRSPTEA